MAAEARTPAADLIAQRLAAESRDFTFFQAVALIQDRLDEGREPGTHLSPGEEKLFFEVNNRIGFPTSDILGVRSLAAPGNALAREDGGRFVMTVNFMGLHGSGSPLPSYYVEDLAGADPLESTTKHFFDFFHNRILGLLYRIWQKYRYYRRYRPGGDDGFSRWVFAFFGLGDSELRASTLVYWPKLLCFAGILSTRNRSPAILSAVIAHAFSLKRVEIEEWTPRKVDIPPDQMWRNGGGNSRLGHSTVIGSRAPDIQGKIRIVLHDLDYRRFRDFLPRGQDFRKLRNLVEFLLRDQLAYDFKLCLAPHESRPLTLQDGDQERLGWSSFLGEKYREQTRSVIIGGRI
jgi:type VI secretion system protein ImpH